MGSVWIIIAIIYSLLWGIVCSTTVGNKGYHGEEGKWFVIGFLLGIFGFLLVVTKPVIANPNPIAMQTKKIAFDGWICSCGRSNDLDDDICQSCGKTQLSVKKSASRPKPTPVNKDWRCTCGAMNKEYETSCHRCGKAMSEATWKCSCGMRNQKNAAFCEKCGNSAPSSQPSKPTVSADSISNEIKKYKEMLDEGLITEEEFAAKKKQLLGI